MAVFASRPSFAGKAREELELLDRSRLLELLPHPAIVYDRTSDLFLMANRRFHDQLGFTLKDLPSISIKNLIPGGTDTNPTGESKRTVRVKNVAGDLILADLRILSLSSTNQVVILDFGPPDSELEFRRALIAEELVYDNYTLLSALASQTSVSALLTRSLELCRKVLNPKLLAIYTRRDNLGYEMQTNSVEQSTGILPRVLDLNEFSGVLQPNLWKAIRAPLSHLHEIALANEYQYLLTLPLVDGNVVQGLIVMGGTVQTPNDDELRFFALLGRQTGAMLTQLWRLEKAQKTLARMRQVVQLEHAITDNLEEGVIILTHDLRIAEMSPSAEIMLGYASREVFLQRVEMVLIGNETLTNLYQAAQQGITSLSGNDLKLNTRNGKSFPAQVVTVPVITDGMLTRIVLIVRDLSQDEQIRARTQQLEQRAFLGEVSAIFAHEVKNPVNSISTGLQFLGMSMDPGPNLDLVNRLQNDCARLVHLMDSTLTFSKPMEYHFAPVDLAEMVQGILERWAPRMTRLNIRYNFSANPKQTIVHGDYRALEQVFVNLVSNAIQAMDRGNGTLSIKIQNAPGKERPLMYEVIVADSGPGISEDLVEHVFEPFMTTKSSGTGLGLAITKRIVNAHKGKITVESFPGGTVFHVQLPKTE